MDEKKSIFKDIKEKTAGMNFRDKIEYLWEYYRLPFLLTVCGVIFVISLTTTIFTNQLKDPALNCGVVSDLDAYFDQELSAALEATFPESTGFKKPQITCTYSPANETMRYGTVQLTTYLGNKELDCLICDKETLEFLEVAEVPHVCTDITDTSLGRAAQLLKIDKLYFVIFTEYGRVEDAEKFLDAVQALDTGY